MKPESKVEIIENDKEDGEAINLELIDRSTLRANYFDKENSQWQDLKVSEDLIRGLVACKLLTPSKIQLKSIPLIMDTSQHLLAQARNGSGKTISFLVGVLSKIDLTTPCLQVLIVAPHRELMNQIYSVCLQVVKYMDGLQIAKVTDLKDNSSLKTAHLVVSSPGVAIKAIKKQAVSLEHIKTVVFDEADVLLGDEHSDHSFKIASMMREKKVQFLAFTATVTESLLSFYDSHFKDAYNKLTVSSVSELSLDGVKHLCITVSPGKKIEILDTMYKAMTVGQCIIFVNTKKCCYSIQQHLEKMGKSCTVLTGDLRKEERDKVIIDFEEGKAKVLVSTNLIARGYDEKKVNLVINYDIPMKNSSVDANTYLHRVGRTGRFGRLGIAVNVLTSDEDKAKIVDICSKFNIEMEEFDNDDIDQIIEYLEKVEKSNSEDLI